jgi:hypothetical protein
LRYIFKILFSRISPNSYNAPCQSARTSGGATADWFQAVTAHIPAQTQIVDSNNSIVLPSLSTRESPGSKLMNLRFAVIRFVILLLVLGLVACATPSAAPTITLPSATPQLVTATASPTIQPTATAQPTNRSTLDWTREARTTIITSADPYPSEYLNNYNLTTPDLPPTGGQIENLVPQRLTVLECRLQSSGSL